MKRKNDFLEAILANQTAIANAFGIEIPSPIKLNSKPRLNPLKLLPPELKDLLTDVQAFLNAFEGDNPILSVKNGMIVSNFDSDTLHSYLLSMLFTDDYTVICDNHHIWKSGNQNFPNSALSSVFVMRDASHLRRNHLNSRTPRGHERVDNLFNKK